MKIELIEDYSKNISEKDELDWEPSIVLDEGLKRTIEYFRGVV